FLHGVGSADCGIHTCIFGYYKIHAKRKRRTLMKFRTWTSLTVVCLFAALAITLPTSAQGHITEFDAPGAAKVSSPACAPDCGTLAQVNNDLGVIVGYYTDEYVVPHGFLRNPDGSFTKFDAPGAGTGAFEGTAFGEINLEGATAGVYYDGNDVAH